ncbi:MAG: TRAP transporter fused permease subunit [Deltaproteobacteria bacterium]|nr:TRAP transporter fused permease subunit [Deltaproteobacteria bacterium]
MREIKGPLGWLVTAVAVFTSLFHLYMAGFGTLEPRIRNAMHLILLLPLAFLLLPASKKSPRHRPSVLDFVLTLASVTVCAFVIIENDRLNARWEYVSPILDVELVLGTIAVALVLEATRRAVSGFLTWLTLFGLVYYSILGSFLPGFLYCRPVPYERLVESMYLKQGEGVFGSLTGVSANYVVLFILFGAVIAEVGVGDYFMKLAKRVAGWASGGPAKIAVLTSALFGSISGIAVANVYTTGSFTIPMMKRLGYRPRFAAAVEATASTGGQFMPPVMGVAAFIMAEFLGVPYFNVAIASLIPAILFFMACGFMVHYEAKKLGLRGIPWAELPPWREVFKESFLILPIVTLIMIMMAGYSAFMAAFISIFVALALGILGIFLKMKEVALTPKKLLRALEMGAKNSIMIAIACCVADIFTTAISHSGLGLAFTSIVTSASGGIPIVALMLIALACLILGMGLPTIVAYILASAIGVPVMLKFGVPPMAAHLFTLYFAVIGCVTPPVCVSAYAGASIAGSDPLKTGWEATKLSLTGFIIPFAFAFEPALLMNSSPARIVWTLFLALIGAAVLAIGLERYFRSIIGILSSFLLIIGGCALYFGHLPVLVHLGILVVIAGVLFFESRGVSWKTKRVAQG